MKELNSEQRAAVESPALLKLVVAGPGSGKTATMVAAVAARIKAGVKPEEVVVLTFTNTAASEFGRRLDEVTGVKPRQWGFVGTLHAFLFGLLRKHGAAVGLPETLSVLDEDAVEQTVESVVAEMGVKCPLKKVMTVLNWPNLVEGKSGMSYAAHELVAKEFHAQLRREGLLTFDTILFYGEKLVKALAIRAELPRWPFQALFVDEVQDSSPADWRIYDAMPCRWKFLVGDPDQAIYSFRGGDVSELTDRWEGGEWERHALQSNYRCGAEICATANALIKHNTSRVDKVTDAVRDGGDVTAHAFENPAAEQCFVLDEIARLTQSKLRDPDEKGQQ